MNKAIFLDRDGTLNPDPGYISDPKDYSLFPGVTEALAKLQKAGYMLILITNQSGISRGLFTEEQLNKVHEKMDKLLSEGNVKLDAIYYCPHHPEHPYKGIADCDCRKPKPGMILRALKEHDINPKKSYMIGDRSSDIKIGLASEVSSICISPEPLKGFENIPTFETLKEASEYILNQ